MIINLLKGCLETDSIPEKPAKFYIFEIGLQNAALIEERRKYLERPLDKGRVLAPRFSAIIKNGNVQ